MTPSACVSTRQREPQGIPDDRPVREGPVPSATTSRPSNTENLAEALCAETLPTLRPLQPGIGPWLL